MFVCVSFLVDEMYICEQKNTFFLSNNGLFIPVDIKNNTKKDILDEAVYVHILWRRRQRFWYSTLQI